ncbi:MAG: hypothetical protein AAFW67_13565 [Cyanobacteria bacterium J06638_38]
MANIKELIQMIVKPMVKPQHVRAEVESVDTSDQHIQVKTLEHGSKRFKVKLRVIADGEESGFILYPKVGSPVIIGIVDNNPADCFVAQYSECDGMQFVIKDKHSFKVDANGNAVWTANNQIHFDGATNGLIKIPELVQKINTLESDLNALKTAFNGWTPVPNDGGGALKIATGAWAGSSITQTTESDIKHDKVEY